MTPDETRRRHDHAVCRARDALDYVQQAQLALDHAVQALGAIQFGDRAYETVRKIRDQIDEVVSEVHALTSDPRITLDHDPGT